MTFDCSRFSFNSWNDYLGVVMQQGRVQLDSDWNEWLSELARRIQAGTMDTLGRAVYPVTTPDGFKINAFLDANKQQHISIGAGRMYVDGLLAENHGLAVSAQWDASLAELSCTAPGAAEVGVDFTQQPYYPGAMLPAGGNGPFLAYLDIWQRPVSYLGEPSLVETAVGVDTTGRIQTVWQVKLLDVSPVAGGVTCSTPDSGIPPWTALIQPSAARLTTGVVPSAQRGPCALSQATGYTGLENQLYRVQIHQGGTANASGTVASPSATFKWSRDNASVITAVTAISAATSSTNAATSQLTVQSIGRDQVLGFHPGDWIEIIDDYMELNSQAGELHQIDTNGIDKAARTITLVTPIGAAFTTRLNDKTRNYHTRICRWDQNAANGKVYQTNGNILTLWVDLATAGTGQIPVPPPGTTLVLENGVTVTFDLNPATGSFVSGDFWAFPARTADGSVGPLTEAPPMGIHHHYARLAVVTFPTTASDCRIQWPPSASAGCCCSVMVSPGDITNTNSLQNILDQHQNQQRETVICLMPGTYPLTIPLRLTLAHSNISLTACQPGTAILSAMQGQESQFGDGLIVLDNISNVTLRGLKFVIPVVPFAPANGQFVNLPVRSLDPDVQTIIDNLQVSIALRPFNCTGLTIEECQFDFPRQERLDYAIPFGIAVFAGGQCAGWRIAKNTFAGLQDFTAGFVLAPSAAFNAPVPLLARPGRPTPPGRAAPGPIPAPAAPAIQPVGNIPGGFGRLQNILSLGASLPGLAAAGGTVIPATLNDAALLENTFTGLSIAVLVLAETGIAHMINNEVTNCRAGFWLSSPTEAAFLANDARDIATLVGSSLAMGYPPPQGDATQPVQIAAAPASIRITTGAKAYTDSLGNLWTPDADTSAGFAITGTSSLNQPVPPPVITDSLPASTDQPLYQSERFGNFTYAFSGLPEGYYQITLKFAEIFWSAAGTRIFDVSINGVQVITNLDIYSDASGRDIADDKLFQNIAPSGGTITLQFSPASYSPDQDAKISSAGIDAQWSAAFVGTAPAAGSGITEIQNFCAQLTALAEQGYANLGAPPQSIRINDNEMRGLTSVALMLLGGDSVQNARTSSLMMAGNRLVSLVGLPVTRQNAFNDFNANYLAADYIRAVTTLANISQCVVSGNAILNEQANSDYRLAFFLADHAIPNPRIVVAGNIFQGYTLINPPRYPTSTTIPYPMNSWDFLNTVL